MQFSINKPVFTFTKKVLFTANEKGSILVVATLVLFILSFLGIFALNTTDVEINIAANQHNWDKSFNVSEGGAKLEGTKVGFARPGVNDWYEISDPGTLNQFLVPPGTTPGSSYDPGSDMTETIPGTFDNAAADDYKLWPCQNIMDDITDNVYDYAYLVTYLFPDTPPKGYDSTNFSGYKFRINGEKKVIIELGGIKVGVKSAL
jgi:hypothetical protein